jgi:hypothetical protein
MACPATTGRGSARIGSGGGGPPGEGLAPRERRQQRPREDGGQSHVPDGAHDGQQAAGRRRRPVGQGVTGGGGQPGDGEDGGDHLCAVRAEHRRAATPAEPADVAHEVHQQPHHRQPGGDGEGRGRRPGPGPGHRQPDEDRHRQAHRHRGHHQHDPRGRPGGQRGSRPEADDEDSRRARGDTGVPVGDRGDGHQEVGEQGPDREGEAGSQPGRRLGRHERRQTVPAAHPADPAPGRVRSRDGSGTCGRPRLVAPARCGRHLWSGHGSVPPSTACVPGRIPARTPTPSRPGVHREPARRDLGPAASTSRIVSSLIPLDRRQDGERVPPNRRGGRRSATVGVHLDPVDLDAAPGIVGRWGAGPVGTGLQDHVHGVLRHVGRGRPDDSPVE